MIYRGPGILAVAWFGSSPSPYPPLPSVSSTGATRETEKERQLADGRVGGGGGAESYDHEKAGPL